MKLYGPLVGLPLGVDGRACMRISTNHVTVSTTSMLTLNHSNKITTEPAYRLVPGSDVEGYLALLDAQYVLSELNTSSHLPFPVPSFYQLKNTEKRHFTDASDNTN
jgi:hypothetical protein